MKKNNLFQRFRYWLDKRMAKGTVTNVCDLYINMIQFVV